MDTHTVTEVVFNISTMMNNTTSDMFENNVTCTSNSFSTPEAIEDYTDLKIHLARTRFIVQQIIIPLVVIFGILGNLMSIIVLTRSWMRSSTNYYLTALAIYDTLYLIFATTMTVGNYENIKELNWYTQYQYPIGKPLVDTFSNSAVWLTLTFTIERWLCVCHPMRGRIWCTPKRARYIIVIVCFAAALITFPEFFEKRIVKCEECNRTIPRVNNTNFGNSVAYQIGYIYTCQVLFTFLPLFFLLKFNILLILAVYQAAKRRTSMVYYGRNSKVNEDSKDTKSNGKGGNGNSRKARNQKDQQKVTITLISVVVVFIFCHSPQAIQSMYLSYYSGMLSGKRLYISLITANIFNLLVMCNASINFVLYSTFNTRFRHTFKRLSLRTYRRFQGKSGSNNLCNSLQGSDSNSPYRETTTINHTTRMTKINTDENLHRHLVIKSDPHNNRNCQHKAIPISRNISPLISPNPIKKPLDENGATRPVVLAVSEEFV